MARVFVYDGREFPDPGQKIPAEEVRKQLSEYFPELANADTRQEQRGEDTVYTFARRIGTKGSRALAHAAEVVAALREVPSRELLVFDLASELLDPQGELDLDAATRRRPEVHLALAEAQACARATKQAREALCRLLPSA